MGAKANPPCPPFSKGGSLLLKDPGASVDLNASVDPGASVDPSAPERTERFAPFEKGGYGGFALALVRQQKH
jgi:hypothetical protein